MSNFPEKRKICKKRFPTTQNSERFSGISRKSHFWHVVFYYSGAGKAVATLAPFRRGAFWCPKCIVGSRIAFWTPKSIFGPKITFWGHFCALARNAYDNGFCIGFCTFWCPNAEISTFTHFGPQKCKMSIFCILGSKSAKSAFFAVWDHLGPFAPPPRGAARAGDGWLGEDGEGREARVGWAASGASAWERRPPLGGSGRSARQGQWSFLFTPIPAGGLLVYAPGVIYSPPG